MADPLTISSAKLRHYFEGIVNAAALAEAAGTPLSQEQLAGWWQALVKQLFWRRRKKPRRARSCARAVRQPVTSWPRLVATDSQKGAITTQVLAIKQHKASRKTPSNLV